VKNSENCQFLMIKVKKGLNGVHVLKKEISENLQKK